MRKSGIAFVLAAFAAASPLAASAAPITVPPGLNPGDPYRLAFVTSTTRNAASLDQKIYRNFVTNAANSVPELAALGTMWTAIAGGNLSDAVINTLTFDTGVPIYRLDGLSIADDYPDLWDGSLDRPLSITEQGQPISVEVPEDPATFVFTGTNSSGGESYPNGLGAPNVTVGNALSQDSSWIDDSIVSNDGTLALHFYAISGVLTVVPEPGTIVLACMAAAGLAVLRFRKRPLGSDRIAAV